MKNFEKFLAKYKNTSQPIKIEKIIKDLWITINYVKSNKIDWMCVQIEWKWHILCKWNVCEARRRFTLAHELKHYLEKENAYAIQWQMRKKMEREANYFAWKLLVPWMALSNMWNEMKDIQKVAKIFKVSPQVVRLRLTDLWINF